MKTKISLVAFSLKKKKKTENCGKRLLTYR